MLAICQKLLDKDTKATTFAITDTKHCVPVVNYQLKVMQNGLEQLRTGFKRTINWNKYQSKV